MPLVKPNAFHLPLASNIPVIFCGWKGWYLNGAAESQFLEGFSTDQTENRTKNPGYMQHHGTQIIRLPEDNLFLVPQPEKMAWSLVITPAYSIELLQSEWYMHNLIWKQTLCFINYHGMNALHTYREMNHVQWFFTSLHHDKELNHTVL